MPSEKEIEEAIAIADDMWVSRTLCDAYLSIKAERDKYKVDLGLAEVSLRYKTIQLDSCEKALESTQRELENYQRTYD